jgi:hypothetical protein
MYTWAAEKCLSSTSGFKVSVYKNDADPDQGYHFDADVDANPDPTFQSVADPDPHQWFQVPVFDCSAWVFFKKLNHILI